MDDDLLSGGYRPRLGENEEDLLEMQRNFLEGRSAGAAKPAATVTRVRGGDKISDSPYDLSGVGGSEPQQGETKQNTRASQPNVTQVLSGILEHTPHMAGQAAAVHPSPPSTRAQLFKLTSEQPDSILPASKQKKRTSLFARRFDALAQAKGMSKPKVNVPQPSQYVAKPHSRSGPSSSTSTNASLSEAAQQENLERIKAMSEEEIEEAHAELKTLFSSKNLEFLANRGKQLDLESGNNHTQQSGTSATSSHASTATASSLNQSTTERKNRTDKFHHENQSKVAVDESVNPGRGWLHMDKYEPEKLAWTHDVVAPTTEEDSAHPIRNREARFDLEGNVLDPEVDLPTHLGLHHHGDNPHQAGYTLGELVRLIRSSVQQQRILALTTITKVLRIAWIGGYDHLVKEQLSGLPGEEAPSDNVLGCLMGMGVALFLRGALDDSAPRIVVGGLEAISALLVYPLEESFFDHCENQVMGRKVPPMSPPRSTTKNIVGSATGDSNSDDEDPTTAEEAQAMDIEECRKDLVEGLLRTDIILRLRYILKDMAILRQEKGFAETNFLTNLIYVLTRISRHSLSAASAIADCPLLVDSIFDVYIAPALAAGDLSSGSTNVSLLCHLGLKLLRILCDTGRNIAMRLLPRSRMTSIAAIILSYPNMNTRSLDRVTVVAEAYRILRACLGYAIHGEVFVELYEHFIRGIASIAIKSTLCTVDCREWIAMLDVVQSATAWVATRGSSTELPLRWHHIVHFRDPILSLLERTDKVVNGSYTAYTAKTYTASEELHCSFDLMAAGLTLLKSYHDAMQKSPEYKIVEYLDLASMDCDFILNLSIAKSIDGFWTMATNSISSTSHGGHMTPYRFRFLPSILQGVAQDKLEVQRRAVLNLLLCQSDLLGMLASKNKGLLDKCAALYCLGNSKEFINVCAKSPNAMDRHDMYCYRNLLQLNLQMEIIRWTLLTSPTNLLETNYQKVAAKTFMLLPPGCEEDVKILLGVVLHISDMGMEAITSDDMKQVLSFYTQRLAVGVLLVGKDSYSKNECRIMPRRTIHSSERLPMSSKWLLEPLQELYHSVQSASGAAAIGEAFRMIQLVLVCLSAIKARQLLDILVPDEDILSSLLYVFAVGHEIYSDETVEPILVKLWDLAASVAPAKPQMTSAFLLLYQNLVAEFGSMSYGNKTLAKYLLLPMQRKYPVEYRLELFDSDRFLELCTIPVSAVQSRINSFLQPCEIDGRMIQLYVVALLGRKVQSSRSSLLYWTAIHHVCAFVFKDCSGGYPDAVDPATILDDTATATIEKHRRHILAQMFVAASDELYRHIVFYRFSEEFDPIPQQLKLAEKRAALLRSVAQETPEVRASALQRHPSLLN